MKMNYSNNINCVCPICNIKKLQKFGSYLSKKTGKIVFKYRCIYCKKNFNLNSLCKICLDIVENGKDSKLLEFIKTQFDLLN